MTSPLHIEIDLRANALRLRPADGEPVRWAPGKALVDIGERGHLLAVEVIAPADYLSAVDVYEAVGDLARTATTPVRLGLDGADRLVAIELPRSGPQFEIGFPSGNQ